MSVSARAWEMAEANPYKHGWYLDLKTWRWYIENWGDWHPYPTTMPTNNVAGLFQGLKNIFDTGLQAHYDSFNRAAARVREGMAEMGFTLFAEEAYAAPVISALNARPEFAIEELQNYLLEEHGLMTSRGLVELKGKIFRVGHMGLARGPAVIDALLSATRTFMEAKGLV
jgi:alanine-glyoxylate transaminase/serine-glyoxylate transaminase/serine-pyruvate transaminase